MLRDGLGKLGRRPATWVTFAVLAAMMLLVFIVIGASAPTFAQQPGGEAVLAIVTFPGAYDAVLSFILGLGSLLAVIYGAAVAGSEWTWGTLKNAVARGESRARYVLATFGALAAVLAVGLVLALVVGVVAALVGASLAGIATDGVTDPATILGLPEKLARGWLGLVVAASLGFAIATFTRSQLAGIGAGIATYFGEQFGSILFSDIVQYLPFHAADAAANLSPAGGVSVGGQPVTVAQLAPDVALLAVVAWLAGALAVSVLVAERAEITG